MARGRTSTSAFGVGRRESHDASAFYRRFSSPTLSNDEHVVAPADRPLTDTIVHGDIRHHVDALAADSVALVVTSPPYFSGKAYEETLGQFGVPADYEAFLQMLHGVFARCAEVLEPGGRIAVNVANLGRKPYRSLSRDVIDIFEDLGLLLRGEIIWRKSKGAGGNCAWGTYQRPGDPVLRDLTERVVVASKGRFDRAIDARRRQEMGLPHLGSIYRDEFLEATTDVWEMAPEHAGRVGHPAPFPLTLPRRLIDLYTYLGDLVVDPFMGSGTTAVAALSVGRNFVGFDTDPAYVLAARGRVELARADVAHPRPVIAPGESKPADGADLAVLAQVQGRRAKELAIWSLSAPELGGAGFELTENPSVGAGLSVDFIATGRLGGQWLVDVVGSFASTNAGLGRVETLQSVVGKAALLRTQSPLPYVVLTTQLPSPRQAGGKLLSALSGPGQLIFDAIELGDDVGLQRLRSYCEGVTPGE